MVVSRFSHRTLTFDQIVAAIDDNSYPQAIGSLFDASNGAACAIGQGALNTGTNERELQTQLGDVGRFIIKLNDGRQLTPQQIAARLRELPAKYHARTYRVARKDWAPLFPAFRGVTVPRGATAARS